MLPAASPLHTSKAADCSDYSGCRIEMPVPPCAGRWSQARRPFSAGLLLLLLLLLVFGSAHSVGSIQNPSWARNSCIETSRRSNAYGSGCSRDAMVRLSVVTGPQQPEPGVTVPQLRGLNKLWLYQRTCRRHRRPTKEAAVHLMMDEDSTDTA
ncbi:hypothetical protein BC567DRAFT_217632 [Phyllosticta citribraziliensis]